MANPIYGLRPRGAFIDAKGNLTWEAIKWMESLLLQANATANDGGQTLVAPVGGYLARSGGVPVPTGGRVGGEGLSAPSASYGGPQTLSLPIGVY